MWNQPFASVIPERDGLLWINGVPSAACQTAFPVGREGTLRLFHVPFSRQYLPSAAEIRWESGLPASLAGNAQGVLWPDSILEIRLHNQSAEPWLPQASSGSLSIFRRENEYAAGANGVLVPLGTSEAPQWEAFPGGLLFLSGKHACAVSEHGDLLLQEKATTGHWDGEALSLVYKPEDEAGHIVTSRYTALGERISREVSHTRDIQDREKAFWDALRLGLSDEAASLFPSLPVSLLAERFLYALPWPRKEEDGWAVLKEDLPGLLLAEHFLFPQAEQPASPLPVPPKTEER